MSKRSIVLITAMVAIHIALAGFMHTAVRAINIENTLSTHQYPEAAQHLTSEHVNPMATQAQLNTHAMGTLPANFDAVTLRSHVADNHQLTDFMRTAIIYRGGTASKKCFENVSGDYECSIQAALPQGMAQEMRELEGTDFDGHQNWISAQPTAPVWQQQPPNEFTLTHIKFKPAKAKIGTWRSDYDKILLAGIAATTLGSIATLIIIPTTWAIAGDAILRRIRTRRENA